jgi:hypothetical protein
MPTIDFATLDPSKTVDPYDGKDALPEDPGYLVCAIPPGQVQEFCHPASTTSEPPMTVMTSLPWPKVLKTLSEGASGGGSPTEFCWVLSPEGSIPQRIV